MWCMSALKSKDWIKGVQGFKQFENPKEPFSLDL